jgi:hypothetical protein
MPDRRRLPSSVTIADMRDAAEVLRQRAKSMMQARTYSAERAARANALHRIADFIEAEALADA